MCHLSLFICLSHIRLGRLCPQMNTLYCVTWITVFSTLYKSVPGRRAGPTGGEAGLSGHLRGGRPRGDDAVGMVAARLGTHGFEDEGAVGTIV